MFLTFQIDTRQSLAASVAAVKIAAIHELQLSIQVTIIFARVVLSRPDSTSRGRCTPRQLSRPFLPIIFFLDTMNQGRKDVSTIQGKTGKQK